LVILLVSLPVRADGPAKVIAVARFIDNAGQPALAAGLAEMVATDLGMVEALTVVDRSRLAAVLEELDLAESGLADPETAARAGRILGARYLVVGSLIAVEPMLRIDARVVDTETTVISAAWTVEGPLDEFFQLEKQLIQGLLRQLDVSPSPQDTTRLSQVATHSYEAFAAWSRAQEALDRGDVAAARHALKAALEHDDGFRRATRDLAALQGRLAELGVARERQLTQEAAQVLALLARSSEQQALAVALAPWARLQLSERCPMASDMLAITNAVGALEQPLLLPLSTPSGAVPAEEWAQSTQIQARWCLGDRYAVLDAGPGFLAAYPLSPLYLEVEATVVAALALEAREQPGRLALSEKNRALALRMDQALCAGNIRVPNEHYDGHITVQEAASGAEVLDSSWIPYPERLPHCRAASRLADVTARVVWIDESYGSDGWHVQVRNRELDEAWLAMATWDRSRSDLETLTLRVETGPHWQQGCTEAAFRGSVREGSQERERSNHWVMSQVTNCTARRQHLLQETARLLALLDGVPRLAQALRQVAHPDDAALLLRDHASEQRLSEVRSRAAALLVRWPTNNALHLVAIEAAWAAGDVPGMESARDAWYAAEGLEPPEHMPAPKSLGQGLTATLYAGRPSADPVYTGSLPLLYPRSHPDLPDHQAVIWEGWIVAPESGEWTLRAYRPRTGAPLDLRLEVDGVACVVIDPTTQRFTRTGSVVLKAGQRTPIRIEAHWEGPAEQAGLPQWTWKSPTGAITGVSTQVLFGRLPERADNRDFHLPPERIATGERLQAAVTSVGLAWRATAMLDLALFAEAGRTYLALATTWESTLNLTVRMMRNYRLEAYVGILAHDLDTFLSVAGDQPFHLRVETAPAEFAPWVLLSAVELAGLAQDPDLARAAAGELRSRWPDSEAAGRLPRDLRR
jgi:TolB-like protein